MFSGLVSPLKLMREVEDIKSVRRRRMAFDLSRKPAGAESLCASGGGPVTTAIADNNGVSAGHVEHYKIFGVGWSGTRVAFVPSELNDEASGSQSCVFEGAAVPFLGTSVSATSSAN